MRKTLNQRGFSTSMILIVVLAIAVIGGGAYYFFSKQDEKTASNRSTNSAESKVANEACKAYINDNDYCKFASNWSANEPMTMVITTEDGSVMTLRTNGNDSHNVFEKDGDIMTETIMLDGASYMKNDDGTWTKIQNDFGGGNVSTSDFTPDFEFESRSSDGGENTEQIKNLGKEPCGNLTCFKYQMIDSTDPGTETLLWFDDKDYKIRRISTSSSDGTSDITYSYGPVNITEPSPVVELPDYENMSIEELQRQFGQ